MNADAWWRGVDMHELAERVCVPVGRKKYSCPCGSSDALHLYRTKAHCFSCGVTYDAPALIMATQDISFREALDVLRMYYSVGQLEREMPERDLDKDAALFDVASFKQNVWSEIWSRICDRPLDDACAAWLKGRHITCSPDVASMEPVHWRDLANVYDEQALRDSGIIGTSRSGRDYWLPWWAQAPWLMFAYRDENAGVTCVRHRRTHDDDGPKVLSPAGLSPPLPFLAHHVEPSDTVWVVEGETDALALRSVGACAVASPGASVWPVAWSRWLRTMQFPHVYIVGDGDAAGRRFVEHVASSLDASTPHTCGLWADGQDACDMLAAGTLLAEMEAIR